ncbi:MAG: hypothetical protein PF513_04005 [Tenericutes bacterium]|jgi:hypothetical protein|nr:hypothetical protein [Mycoplasmatota bacterium]
MFTSTRYKTNVSASKAILDGLAPQVVYTLKKHSMHHFLVMHF